jgi:molecular chaperone DnaK
MQEAEEAIRGNDLDTIKAKSEALGTAAQKLGEKMYAKQQEHAGGRACRQPDCRRNEEG